MANAIAGTLGGDTAADARSSIAAGPRWVDRLDPRLVNVITVLGFGLPVAGYLWLLQRYSLNVIVSDQLADLTVIGRSYTHLFDWGSLWAQHNQNRIFFPNLIVVLLAHTTHFNIQIEEYLSAAMLFASTGLLIWAHKRRSPSTPWLYYCPVALLLLSVVQYQNTLWGFQMAWYLVLLAMMTSVVLIDRVTLTWLSLIGSMATAVIASFSSLQGLLIWPVGLILLYHRRRAKAFVIAWIAAAAASTVVYFYHFNPNTAAPRHGYVLQHPSAAIKFYVFAVGDIVGVPARYLGPGNIGVLLLGLLILVLAGFTLIAYGFDRDERGASPIGVALIVIGLLFLGPVTIGRILFGYFGASQSRYTTYDLLIPIGIYLALLGRPARRTEPHAQVPGELSYETRWHRVHAGVFAWIDRTGLRVVRWVVAAVIVVQIVAGLHYGIEGARSTFVYDERALHVTRNIDHTPDTVVSDSLDVFDSASNIRNQVRIARAHQLSLFAPGSAPNQRH